MNRYVASVSFGKDSLAMLLRLLELEALIGEPMKKPLYLVDRFGD